MLTVIQLKRYLLYFCARIGVFSGVGDNKLRYKPHQDDFNAKHFMGRGTAVPQSLRPLDPSRATIRQLACWC